MGVDIMLTVYSYFHLCTYIKTLHIQCMITFEQNMGYFEGKVPNVIDTNIFLNYNIDPVFQVSQGVCTYYRATSFT
jgi:hypothetical protein